jgi:PAS domain S-box-containing protein
LLIIIGEIFITQNPLIKQICNELIIKEAEISNLKLFIKRLPVAVALLDKNMHYIFTSDRFYEESGLGKDIIGQHHYEVEPDIPKKWRIIHQRCIKGGERLKSDEDTFRRDDGTVEWWRWEVIPWYSSVDEVGGMILFVEDITKQKQIEENLKHMVKTLNASNDALGKFAHICAHDLNEPLRTIASYAQLCSSSKINKNIKSYLETISDNAKYTHLLLQNILEYSQLGLKKLKYKVVSMEDIISKVLTAMESLIKAKKAIVTWKKMPKIYADELLLTQVIQNIVSNSLKFNKSDRVKITISAKENESCWTFSVKDNGIGIKPAHFNKIFVEFMRLNPKSVYKGSGIGLAQCKRIIENHRGKIWVESKPGEGTTVHFTIPKKQNPANKNVKKI